jgi:hypothetical protein
MAIDFVECREVLFRGIMEGLRSCETEIRAIERDARGDSLVNGISLDLTPWHGGIGLAFRLQSDPRNDNSADWDYFEFVSGQTCAALRTAAAYIRDVYRSEGQEGPLGLAHLIFLAGAEALLDERVAEYLRSLDIDAPVVRERFQDHVFEYIVTDPDGTVRANYCEIVVANRWTARLMAAR